MSFIIIDKSKVTRGNKGQGDREEGGAWEGAEGLFFRVRGPAESSELVRSWKYRTTGRGVFI